MVMQIQSLGREITLNNAIDLAWMSCGLWIFIFQVFFWEHSDVEKGIPIFYYILKGLVH